MFSTIKDIFANPKNYRKFWIALGTAVLNLLAVVFTGAAWLPVVIAFAGSVGVVSTPNAPTPPTGV